MSMQNRSNAIVGAVVGFLYAIALGIFSVLMTGGGHGNYIYPDLFFNVFFFGLVFPLMTGLAFLLHEKPIRFFFGLILFTEIFLIVNYFRISIPQNSDPAKFEKWIYNDSTGALILVGVLFLGPLIFYLSMFVRSFFVHPVSQKLESSETIP